VFASYVSRHGHAFIDRALYLPKGWADDRDRLAAAHVPESVRFATKPALARTMIERAIAQNVPFGLGWQPTAFMAWETSRWRSNAQPKAMCWV